jgi:uncharacterized protein YndB with AHSA1/START domain
MTLYTEMTGPRTVQVVRTLKAPIDTVWSYLTDPDLRGRWFAAGPVEPRVGGRLTLTFRHSELSATPAPERLAKFEGSVHEAEVTRWDPPRAFGFTFGGEDAEALFELEPVDGGTRLTLTHSNLQSRAGMINVSGGWHAHIAVLEDILSGGERRDFWREIEAAEAYAERTIPKDE